MRKTLNRREVLGRGVAGAGVWLSGATSTWATSNSPNEKLNIAMIGAGGRGAQNLVDVASENIVALCDVDDRRAASSYSEYPRAKRFRDFRKMLGDLEKQIDAVVVSAPNHIHAPASLLAMKMGKHCYCEKPLTHSIEEARTVARVAAESKVATQMGTQIHATENYRRIVELIRAGAIGAVDEIRIRLARGGTANDRPLETPAIPEGLAWDLWLGPAPHRPYHPCYVPHDWHYWWDFGGGPLGNMGCHYLDLAFWALDLRHPTSVVTDGPRPHPESTPYPLTVRWNFPARGELPPVTLWWDHGRKRPPFWETHSIPDWAWGVFVGSKGMLLASYDKHLLWPTSQFADFPTPDRSIAPSIGHHQEWITACKTGSATTCNFDYSGALTETVLLANVAFRAQQQIVWDPVGLKITNEPSANQFLRRDYREGWDG